MAAETLSQELAHLAGLLTRHVDAGHVLMPQALAPVARVLRDLVGAAVALEARAAELEAVARDLDALPLLTPMREVVVPTPVPGTNVVVLPFAGRARS